MGTQLLVHLKGGRAIYVVVIGGSAVTQKLVTPAVTSAAVKTTVLSIFFIPQVSHVVHLH